MKKIRIIAILLSLCLLLCSCAWQNGSSTQNDPINTNGEQTTPPDDSTDVNNIPDNGEDGSDKPQPPTYPAELMVELVIEWETADALLSQLDDLADLLHTAVEETGCPLDRVTLTISTAGGFTAEALVQGGIDAAILPAVDVISYEDKTSILALSDEEIPETAIAVSLANDALSEEFRQLLFKALTETQAGKDFLSACCGAASFSAPSEEGLAAVRDYLRELEKGTGGHAQ